MTGVNRAYRGQGISLAIKVVALSWANAPMLATDSRLGYKPEPGFYTYGKRVR